MTAISQRLPDDLPTTYRRPPLEITSSSPRVSIEFPQNSPPVPFELPSSSPRASLELRASFHHRELEGTPAKNCGATDAVLAVVQVHAVINWPAGGGEGKDSGFVRGLTTLNLSNSIRSQTPPNIRTTRFAARGWGISSAASPQRSPISVTIRIARDVDARSKGMRWYDAKSARASDVTQRVRFVGAVTHSVPARNVRTRLIVAMRHANISNPTSGQQHHRRRSLQRKSVHAIGEKGPSRRDSTKRPSAIVHERVAV